jgi:small GTP-binding protein
MYSPMETYKIILIGDVSVGKTNLLTQYVHGKFAEKTNNTIGIEFKNKIIEIKNGRKIRLQIWDTCGQEKFMSITKNYFRGCSAALFVFDVTKRKTYKSLQMWLSLFNEIDDEKTTIKLLIGNKKDLNQKQVREEEIEIFTKDHFLKYFEVTTRNKENIDAIFDEIVKNLKEKENNNPINDNSFAINKKDNFVQINGQKNNPKTQISVQKNIQKRNKKSQKINQKSNKNTQKKNYC